MLKMGRFGEIGVLRSPRGYRQCHHSIERIRLPIRLIAATCIRLSCAANEIWPSTDPKSIYFATPLAFNAPDRGVALDDLRKILHEGQRMAKVHRGEEILPRASTANVTDRRQTTDGLAIAKTRT